ncbi:DMT family transporter [Salibacterium lacus]|uniref:DMT family transporter n=1 Tax=Salibacterium lacus TaxID=1898109 RepID=A0ABW5T5G8_9BACI
MAGILLIASAAVLWGISGGLSDILMNKGWDPLVISFYRGFIGFLCFFFWYIVRREKNRRVNAKLIIWAAAAGIGVAGNFTFYALSIEQSSVAVAVTLMYTAPVFVFIISFLFGLERFTFSTMTAVIIVIGGIVLLTKVYNIGAESISVAGLVTGVMAGLSYSLFIFGFKNATNYRSPQIVLPIAFLTLSVVLFFFTDRSALLAVPLSGDIFWFILLGLCGAGLSFILYTFGIRRTSPTNASLVAMMEPITASLFGYLILGQLLSPVQVVGMLVILLTITLLSMRSFKKES